MHPFHAADRHRADARAQMTTNPAAPGTPNTQGARRAEHERLLAKYIKRVHATNDVFGLVLDTPCIDVEKIATENPGVGFQKGVFSALVFQNSDNVRPKTCSVYQHGLATGMASRDPEDAILAAWNHIYTLRHTFGLDFRVKGMYTANLVFKARLFYIDIDMLASKYPVFKKPKIFKATFLRCRDIRSPDMPAGSRIVFGFFRTGCAIIIGAKNYDEMCAAYRVVFMLYLADAAVRHEQERAQARAERLANRAAGVAGDGGGGDADDEEADEDEDYDEDDDDDDGMELGARIASRMRSSGKSSGPRINSNNKRRRTSA
jgi:TATA-box binding protein (TBP) (component of TFIID and TFIIIB)